MNIQYFSTMEASNEQIAIINALDNNVIVDAVAGSGKTTTILLSMKNFKGNALLLTYNTILRLNSRIDAQNFGVNNLDIHTYNSFGYKYVGSQCRNNSGFTIPYELHEVPQYDRIYIDEIQDCQPIYYELILKILKTQNNPILCVLGDPRQNIYRSLKQSDHRYLTMADKLFPSIHKWKYLTLTTTYRLTSTMADFINNNLGVNRFVSTKNGPKVQLITCNPCNLPESLINKIKSIKPSELFILSYSIKNNKAVEILCDKLVEWSIPIVTLNEDDVSIDEKILRNKVIVSTIHRIKGMGRRYVILFDFDSNYCKLDKDSDSNTMANAMYVALTRSSGKLILIENSCYSQLSWLKTNIGISHEIHDTQPYRQVRASSNYSIRSVKEFTKYISHSNMIELQKLLSVNIMQKPSYDINIASIVPGVHEGTYESVSEITGVAIPAYVEYNTTSKMAIYDYISHSDEKLIYNYTTISDLLKLATKYVETRDRFMYRSHQIKNFDWITEFNLKFISNFISPMCENGSFEKEVNIKLQLPGSTLNLVGCIDCLTEFHIYEFKCTNRLTSVDQIQLMLYDCIMKLMYPLKSYKSVLVNLLSGECQEIKCSDRLKFMNILVQNNLNLSKGSISDSDFIDEVNKLKNKVYNNGKIDIKPLYKLPITQVINHNPNGKLLYIDTETSGIGCGNGHDENNILKFDGCRIMSICFGLFDSYDTFDHTKLVYKLISHTFDYEPSRNALRVNKLSKEICNKVGVSILQCGIIEALKNTKTIIGYNVSFDYNVLMSELLRYGVQVDIMPSECAMQKAYKYLGVRKGKLSEICKKLDVKTSDLTFHNAKDDVIMMARLLQKIT